MGYSYPDKRKVLSNARMRRPVQELGESCRASMGLRTKRVRKASLPLVLILVWPGPIVIQQTMHPITTIYCGYAVKFPCTLACFQS